MKRTMIFALLLCFGMALSAQSIAPVVNHQEGKEYMLDKPVEISDVSPFENTGVNMLSSKGLVDINETELGETFYDLQTNAAISNRFVVWDDGTMAAVWTRGLEASAFPNRGTGYNFNDGSAWGPWPEARIEDRRCGWPSIAAWGTGGEIVVAHNGQAGLEISQRATKGSGAWTQTNFLGPAGNEDDITWPRLITSGPNNEYIHIIVNSNSEHLGQAEALLYSRSSDGGATWDPHNVVLDEMGEDYIFEYLADGYTLAARGNTVCILAGSPWQDLFYMRSDDNGDTWDKQMVWEHPYPLLDPETEYTDTFFCMDRTAQMTIDSDGHAHVVFALQRAIADESGAGLYAWNPDYDGIAYWNDEMEPFSDDINALAPPQLDYPGSEMVQDENYIGWMQDVDGDGVVTLEGIMNYHSPGMSTMPSIFVDDDGNRFLIYSSNTETFVYTAGAEPVNYKHIWYRLYTDGAWGDFQDLSSGIAHVFDECIYPMIGDASNGLLHYIYNADLAPGNAFNGNHDYQQNRTVYAKMDIPVGLIENDDLEALSIGMNPNPATEKAMVSFRLDDPSDVQVILTNITGQIVREVSHVNMNGNVNIALEVSDLPAGTYICTVRAGKMFAAEKLIVR